MVAREGKVAMQILKCALGVLQQRGRTTIPPSVVPVGATEADFLIRHVEKVREHADAGVRSLFSAHSSTASMLETLVSPSTSDALFEQTSLSLQDALAKTMITSTNAKDCVFAVVLSESDASQRHATILKLDAVVEAAQMKLIGTSGVSFKVLRNLLPEPGQLQKALSWPDSRSASDAILVDTNSTHAAYFVAAYQIEASVRSPEAEQALVSAIASSVAPALIPSAIRDAAQMSGPLDDVVRELAGTYPELGAFAASLEQQTPPAGFVRENKVSSRQFKWTAPGFELRLSSEHVASMEIADERDGMWSVRVLLPDKPEPS